MTRIYFFIYLAAVIIVLLFPRIKSMLCLSCSKTSIKYVSNARLTKVQQKEKNCYPTKGDISCGRKKKILFLLTKHFHSIPNKPRLLFLHVGENRYGSVHFDDPRKVLTKSYLRQLGSHFSFGIIGISNSSSGNFRHRTSSLTQNWKSKIRTPLDYPLKNRKHFLMLKMSDTGESTLSTFNCTRSGKNESKEKEETIQLKSNIWTNENKTADNSIHMKEKNIYKDSYSIEQDTFEYTESDLIIRKKCNENHWGRMDDDNKSDIKKNHDGGNFIRRDNGTNIHTVDSYNNHSQSCSKSNEHVMWCSKYFTIEQLEDIRKNCNYLKINKTENDEFNIELYFHFKEFKLLRKKDELLKSLMNRLILNIKKSEQKKKKELKKSRNRNTEPCATDFSTQQNDESSRICIQFFDSENNVVDENATLVHIVNKLSYVLINEHKIDIFKGLYDLKQIYVSMDVYNGHPIIPVNVPLADINEYAYYWVRSNNNKVIISCDLFYKPSKEDVNKNIQLVIYNKKNPFFFYVTNEIEVLRNEFEEELKRKENRYADFIQTININDDRSDNLIRILTYNILAPIYTNTKYALEYMFKNVDPCYLKTNYRSHLLIDDISHHYDIISLQEVSEHLHSNLFSVYLHENFYTSYKPKNNYGNDGCSLFVNKKKFTLIEYKNYEFNQVIKNSELKEVYDTFINLSEDLEEIIREIKTIFQIGIYTHIKSAKIFLIANTHFYFHSLASHIRAMQSYTLLHILETLKKTYEQKYSKPVYVVLNGDFNTNFESEVFSFFEGKDITSNSDIWINAKLFKKEFDDLNKYPTLFDLKKKSNNSEQISGPYLNRKIFMPLYSAYKKGDISYTNWNNNFIDVLDYIFLSPSLKVKRILKGIEKEIFHKYNGVLSPIHPSDHISIAAEVEM
ncbi:endonuclease/exonuclease/phosphatase domain containing protein [Plasmodium gonderi]|uniref:Endonuclease/exonuclease/phosphatase domain containing protein n=1 Tax=Plasmodium gonderi TaxID=77519 RepID=A0A1Y1JIK1_PLAGO|nr:endonuclease/exonuclease/phosphatase domain containing protein [Plasmodium gonderi]GAW80632.1 endonuclease/exonuclease/phosphatase domain containing protein [Plasmodium gonderi]